MKKFNNVEEVLKMKDLRRMNGYDLIKMAREKGIVCGEVIMNSQRFIKLCHLHGFKPTDFKFLWC